MTSRTSEAAFLIRNSGKPFEACFGPIQDGGFRKFLPDDGYVTEAEYVGLEWRFRGGAPVDLDADTDRAERAAKYLEVL